MRFTRLRLEKWRNFLNVDISLQRRAFLVGPNASGKSNLLDAFRFLRDIADAQGGFQQAVNSRGGVSQIRSLHARRYPNIVVEVEAQLNSDPVWGYRLEFSQDNLRRPIIKKEIVRRGQEIILNRPDKDDEDDSDRLTQTHLEQVNANKKFRNLAEFFSQVRYLHIVPQLVREPERSVGKVSDPFGGDFLEQLARTQRANSQVFGSRLRRIKDALGVAVPQLKGLVLERDERGIAHLKGRYSHWRPNAGWQTEGQFSDGTLRLLGLLWAFLDGTAPLLLEEPELSLHSGVVRHIPQMMARIGRKTGRQILMSTHSADLLSDEGIAPEEVLLLVPSNEDTNVEIAVDNEQIRALLEGGASIGEAVIPRTAPRHAQQLAMFGE